MKLQPTNLRSPNDQSTDSRRDCLQFLRSLRRRAKRSMAPMLAKIRDEGLNRSQVMDHMVWLTDVYGPRLTGSPTFHQAGAWAVKTLGGVGD